MARLRQCHHDLAECTTRGGSISLRQFVATAWLARDSAISEASHSPCDAAHAMRVTITCEECGERHRLERRVSEPGPIWIVCHNCELRRQAFLDGVTAPPTAPAAPPSRTPSAWAGVVDFRSVA